ncbi:hypothetical protein [Alteromonas sp. A079]|uniref:hypothetical protein n=1 Tax=Alteromonas sp. A079 TaxID=3410268 RepID=UPI003BA35B34
MAYKLHSLWKLEKLIRPSVNTKLNQNKNIKWISHHIPKTAGSSLRLSFQKAVGKTRVFGVYANTGAHALTQGNPIWAPFNTVFLHGHFRPHPIHLDFYPNAKRLVWVRDPIERIWSLIGHLLSEGSSHPQHQILQNLYLSKGVTNREDIVYDLIVNCRAEALTHIYKRFFSKVPIEDFAFVGSVHRYDASIQELSSILDMDLGKEFRNVRNKTGANIPAKILGLKDKLSAEYAIVDAYL